MAHTASSRPCTRPRCHPISGGWPVWRAIPSSCEHRNRAPARQSPPAYPRRFIDNDLLVFRAPDATLQVGRLSADRSRFVAPPVPVVPNVLASGAGWRPTASETTERWRTSRARPPAETRPVWVDASGREHDVPNAQPRTYNGVDLSPDGRRAALSTGIVGQSTDVWVLDLDIGSMSAVTRDGRSSRPTWKRDNRTLTWLHFNRKRPRSAAGRGLDRRIATPLPLLPSGLHAQRGCVGGRGLAPRTVATAPRRTHLVAGRALPRDPHSCSRRPGGHTERRDSEGWTGTR